MQNYFNYFTEIEEHFQRRRGSLLLLSTLDWALIETWREAGIPLAAVLKGIDEAFDKFDARKNKTRVRRVNGLAYCAQAVISAVEEMKEAAVGAAPARPSSADEIAKQGFEQERIAGHLEASAQQLRASPQSSPLAEISERLQALARDDKQHSPQHRATGAVPHRVGRKALRHHPLDHTRKPCCSRCASRLPPSWLPTAAVCPPCRSARWSSSFCTSACWKNSTCRGSACSI